MRICEIQSQSLQLSDHRDQNPGQPARFEVLIMPSVVYCNIEQDKLEALRVRQGIDASKCLG